MTEQQQAPQFVNLSDVQQMIADALAENDKKHAEELATVRAAFPQALVPANSGGPGIDNHRPSWNLAEQEAANRGEHLPHWDE
jgi:hypothetical protein